MEISAAHVTLLGLPNIPDALTAQLLSYVEDLLSLLRLAAASKGMSQAVSQADRVTRNWAAYFTHLPLSELPVASKDSLSVARWVQNLSLCGHWKQTTFASEEIPHGCSFQFYLGGEARHADYINRPSLEFEAADKWRVPSRGPKYHSGGGMFQPQLSWTLKIPFTVTCCLWGVHACFHIECANHGSSSMRCRVPLHWDGCTPLQGSFDNYSPDAKMVWSKGDFILSRLT
eukprot:TRINITY_DN42171_c0_g1_i1.p1 TRINITY_DN42171_c0_g1~~TRINITY_DN42171_c0_g1_i1.p1  ORF type:complete len:230 (-),score=22.38 TRINITY_DN42171_c0_g1_i1:541-1230(-)